MLFFTSRSVAPVVAVLRPKGLGLGADRSKAAQLNNSKKLAKDDEEEELLTLKKGAYCVLLKGTNKDLYGMVGNCQLSSFTDIMFLL